MTYDDIRVLHPDLAVSLYGLTPGGAVTLEIIDADGRAYAFEAETAQAAIDQAFPPPDEPAAPELPPAPQPPVNPFE